LSVNGNELCEETSRCEKNEKRISLGSNFGQGNRPFKFWGNNGPGQTWSRPHSPFKVDLRVLDPTSVRSHTCCGKKRFALKGKPVFRE